MGDNFVEAQEEIDELYTKKQYVDCLQKYIKLVNRIDKNNIFNNYKFFKCYCRMANIYAELNQLDSALKYARKAISFKETIEDSILLNWTFSYCYYKINDTKAVDFIDNAIKDLCMIESENWLYQALVHKSLLINDELTMKESINKLENLDIDDDRMDALYIDMFNMYVNLKNLTKAENVINKIKSKILRDNLHKIIFKVANNGT